MAVDYSNRMRCAEEVVSRVIDDILTEGGHMLWQKYLQRKAFPFAAETATDVLVSELRKCFVAHDRGEHKGFTDAEDWDLEQEPIPAEVDNWARMQLTVRRKQKKRADDLSPIMRDTRKLQTQRTRISDSRARNQGRSGSGKQMQIDLKEDVQFDVEEEKLRDARQLEETKRRDRENKTRQNDKTNEVEEQRVQSLHEEMARRLHTFDSEGGLIWVEDLKLDRLPKVQEIVPYFVKRDPRVEGTDGDKKMKGKESPTAKKQRGKKRSDRSSKKADEDDFPDSFSKLQHGQPPILETMAIKPGVVLDVYGKSKAGPAMSEKSGNGMSRKAYVALTEKEVAHEANFASMSDPSAEHQGESGSPHGGPPGTAGSRGYTGGDQPAEGGEGLPPIGGGGLGGSAKRAGSRGGPASSKPGEEGTKSKSEVQMAPAAPSMYVRAKKMQSIGHLGQPPRLHVAPLGGPHGFGVAQPPLGATMGHGLVRHGSMNDSYFFPQTTPEIPSLLRATSDTAFGPKGRSTRSPRLDELSPWTPRKSWSREDSRSQTAPSRSLEMETGAITEMESPRHGVIRVDKKSSAYRGMRQTLFPNTLSSGYVSGML